MYRTTVKISYLVVLSSIPVILVTLVLLPKFGYIPTYAGSDFELLVTELTLGAISLLCLIGGCYYPKLARWNKAENRSEINVFNAHLAIRIPLFVSVIVFSFILGLLGGSWYSVLSMLLFTGVALILTFPTRKKWDRWKGDLDTNK